jgi:hypothetical protein
MMMATARKPLRYTAGCSELGRQLSADSVPMWNRGLQKVSLCELPEFLKLCGKEVV